jgi:hypothetical protein
MLKLVLNGKYIDCDEEEKWELEQLILIMVKLTSSLIVLDKPVKAVEMRVEMGVTKFRIKCLIKRQ